MLHAFLLPQVVFNPPHVIPHACPLLPTHILKTPHPGTQNVAGVGDRALRKLIKELDAGES